MLSCGAKLLFVDREGWADLVKDRLQTALDAKGLSQRELGRKIGITGSAISQRMARENALKDWWALFRIAQELGVSADEILGLKPVGHVHGVDPRLVKRLVAKLEGVAEDARKVASLLPE